MRKKKELRRYSQAAVNTVILVLLLAIFVYLGGQFSRNFSSTVSTLRTQAVTDSSYVYLKGYVFRDESPMTFDQKGVLDAAVEDGSRIGVDQKYGAFYPIASQSDENIKAKQSELDKLNESLGRLDRDASSGTVSDLNGINKTVSSSYYAFVDAILDGELPLADRKSAEMLDALVDHGLITGKGGSVADISGMLEKKKSELIASLGSSGRELVSDESFYLYRAYDGYEGVFTVDALEGLTPDGLQKLASASPVTYSANTVGRMVHSPKWYMAMPTDKATASLFEEGVVYSVLYSGNSDAKVEMELERICVDEKGSAYLLFSSFDLNLSSEISRMQNVKIVMSSVTGYRIPTDALVEKDGCQGVYILVGTVVEFRRVTPIGSGNGYVIVSTYEKDLADDPDNKIPYLKTNDLIITSGNDLYDGKLLD